MLKLSPRQGAHEEVVAERYVSLRRAALHLAAGDEAEAGDLLHDACVRFLLLRPDLDRIEHLDGYLFAMLRNVRLSRLRRHGQRAAVMTDAVEVESLAAAVREPGAADRLRLQDDLTRLVGHACQRSRASRGASIWLLRSIHGYYPTEIAHVTRTPPRAVDRALHLARREGLAALDEPARAGGSHRHGHGQGRGRGARVSRAARMTGGGRRWRDLDVPDPAQAIDALRAQVFASVTGICLSEAALAALYRPDVETDDPIPTLTLAHVVACALCLDRINRLLGLSPLAMRDPLESAGRRLSRETFDRDEDDDDDRGDDGMNGPASAADACTEGASETNAHRSGEENVPGRVPPADAAGADERDPTTHDAIEDAAAPHRAAGAHSRRDGAGSRDAGAERRAADRLLRRAHDTLAAIGDHMPRTLRITTNGLDLGAQPVTAPVTQQDLAIRLAESLAFIEIFDERGALLCYWPTQLPTAHALEEQTTIALSQERRFELHLSLGDDCPRLRVRYTDDRMGTQHAAAPSTLTDVAASDDGATLRGERARGVDRAGPAARCREWFVAWLTPRPRFAVAVGVVFVLWLTLIGPTTTWAALAQIGRAAAAILETLIGPRSPAATPGAGSAPRPTPPPASVSAPSAAAGSTRHEPAAPTFSAGELAELEVAARVALHGIGADLGEDVTLTAAPAGITVRGVVASAARRQTIARAFAGTRGVQVQVQTIGEAATRATARRGGAERRGAGAGGPDDTGSAARDALPPPHATARTGAWREAARLERALIERTLVPRYTTPAARAAFIADVLTRADDALARAWALRRLAERYPPREIDALSARSWQALATVAGDHAAALRTAIAGLQALVAPVLDDLTTPATDGSGTALGSRTPRDDDAIGADVAGSGTILRVFAAVEASHRDVYALLTDVEGATSPEAGAATSALSSAVAGATARSEVETATSATSSAASAATSATASSAVSDVAPGTPPNAATAAPLAQTQLARAPLTQALRIRLRQLDAALRDPGFGGEIRKRD